MQQMAMMLVGWQALHEVHVGSFWLSEDTGASINAASALDTACKSHSKLL